MAFLFKKYAATIKIVHSLSGARRDRFHTGHIAAQARTHDLYRMPSDLGVDLDQSPVVDSRAAGHAATDNLRIKRIHKTLE